MAEEYKGIEIKKKEQLFKGKTLEELNILDAREFAKLLPSNSKRNVLRNFQNHENFLKLVKEKMEKGKKFIKTHKRDLVILPELVGAKLQIYNGREFLPVEVMFEMIGHKLGEFSLTRSKTKHSKEEKSKKKLPGKK
ncbi:30S ribosomal protein S19 [Candidatus Pacearchaeota archaeon CG10_big_fil_rev_8_21_14_0_10_32_42]|nr:MAG: 30S ribosomal protein S19 [Candidatus Pacearchaeota archaeon CG10_big_fil_rev_8_21_14_0_10_32_42]